MANFIINPATVLVYQVGGNYQEETAFSFRGSVSLTSGDSYILDLKSMPEIFKRVKTIWVDNSLGTSDAIVQTEAMRNAIVKAGAQVLFPLMTSPDQKIEFKGVGFLQFTFTDRDLPPLNFAGNASSTVVVSGGVLVSGTVGLSSGTTVGLSSGATVVVSGGVLTSGGSANTSDGLAAVSSGNIGADAYLYAVNSGGTFDRVRALPYATSGFAQSILTSGGVLATWALQAGYDGASIYNASFDTPAADGKGTGAINPVGIANEYVFNNVSWDRRRGNYDLAAIITLTAQAAGTVNSADQTNYNNSGVVAGLNLTALGAATTVTLNIQGKDSASGVYYTIASTTAVAATGFTSLSVHPGITVVANSKIADILPRTWRAQAVVAGTNTATGTVGASSVV